MMTLIAQNQIQNPTVPTFGSGSETVAFTNLIVTIWRTAITLGGLALLIMLIVGALEWVLAGGDKGKVEHARERMTQAVVGMLVLVGTVAISLFLGGVLDIPLLSPTFVDNLTGGGATINPGANGSGGLPGDVPGRF